MERPHSVQDYEIGLAVVFGPMAISDPVRQERIYSEFDRREMALVDPIPIVKAKLRDRLAAEIPGSRISVLDGPVPTEDMDALRALVPNGLGYVLEFVIAQARSA